MVTFSDLQLSKGLLDSLSKNKFETPTEIQQKAITPAIQGKDIFAISQTGTGKTLAFLIPAIEYLTSNPGKKVLILTPTRELAQQISKAAQAILKDNKNIRHTTLIGGEDIKPQFFALKRRPNLIIGTPGRIIDHLTRKSLNIKSAELVVLDEADRMLDMGFTEQIEEIFDCAENRKQTLLFSATISNNIDNLYKKYLNNPEKIHVSQGNQIAAKLKEVRLNTKNKFETLSEILTKEQGTVIVFVKTQRSSDSLKERISGELEMAESLHGGLKQSKRTKIVNLYRKKKFRVLIATDVASRGLDIDHIECVINYDLPENPEDYIHRVGRTARANKEGKAISLVGPRDGRTIDAIDRFMGNKPTSSNDRPKRSFSSSKRKPSFREGFKEGGFNRDSRNSSFKPRKKKEFRSKAANR